ncbi:hypothetical protein D3C80_2237020 [compost metagenome]
MLLGLRQPLTHLAQLADQPRRILDGIHPIRCIGRMAGRAMDLATHCQLALVA